MKTRLFGILLVVCLLSFVFALLTCGAGEQTGFNAPFGSSVSFPRGPGGEYSENVFACVITDVQVLDPDGNPLNKIQVQLSCAGCEIYDKTDGSTYIADDTPTEKKGDPYFVKTTSLGFYQFLVCFWPASSEDYDAEISANIGVDTADNDFTVAVP